ncbi:DUF58 domain-containing protein [Gracilibacillus kekensis]|uniref:DUF58 domain-containing protein n=1 Tax=Gracilibacillus kekensis TaxID=1027249 RepID=A0A1M7Q7V6_9BACI|nr:DUF58 domain-containing protein [Gracilibacillus kekensis]SHN26686.1 Protein of unknown function DUF58 [Gracilibacillus kekensis]
MKALLRKIVTEVQLFFLLGFLFVFSMFQGGFVSWFLFYSMSPIILYMMMLPFYPLQYWEIDRHLSNRYLQAGGKLDINITINRKFPFPLFFLIVEEDYPESLQFQDIGKKKYQNITEQAGFERKRRWKKVIYPGFKRHIAITYPLDHLPRGKHQLSQVHLKVGDPFGFVEAAYTIDLPQEFHVYPAIQEIKWKHYSLSLEEGASPSHMHDEKLTNVVSGVREYIPGDRFSWIDWKTTARKNTVMTKEFEQEKDSSMALILDVDGLQNQRHLVFEAAIEWTVSILHTIRKKNQNVSFYTLGKDVKYFSNQQLQFQFPIVQNYLATVKQEHEVPLAQKIVSSIPELAKGSTVLFVITHLDEILVDRFVAWKGQEYIVMICYIVAEKDHQLHQEQLIKSLRLKNISVQIITDKQLQKEQWEVNPSR